MKNSLVGGLDGKGSDCTKSIAVLMTCHNRKENTLRCLEQLFRSRLDAGFSLNVHLVDDGSEDYTGLEVKARFPCVTVINGSGNLYWNGGMRAAWESAARSHDYDYYLWLNDDTFINEDAIAKMVGVSLRFDEKIIVCGTTVSPDDSTVLTYGGRGSDGNCIVPADPPLRCDYFNGNCVLVSRHAFRVVGTLDKAFSHSLGDFDYGIRAKKMGVMSYVSPWVVGTCAAHERPPKWRDSSFSVRQRFKYLYHPLGCNPFEFFVFDSRQNGARAAVFHFFTLHLRAMVPRIWG